MATIADELIALADASTALRATAQQAISGANAAKTSAAQSVLDAAVVLAGAAKKSELSANGGDDMIAASAPFVVPYLQTVSDVNKGLPVSLFRFIPKANHSAIRAFSSTSNVASAVQQAFDSGAKRIQVEYGLYNMESSVITAKALSFEGCGEGTIFNQVSVSNRASFQFKSASETQYVEGLRMRDFVVQCPTGTFNEQQHFILGDGLKDAVFSGIKAKGFRGDAIYLGSGIGPEIRHNENIKVLFCVFDGINNENRNAISVIDVTGMIIDGCTFYRCSKSNMPGPIDFEPNNNAWHVVKSIRVTRNRFSLNGGNVGEVAFYVPSGVVSTTSDIVVSDNSSDGYIGVGSFFNFNTNRAVDESSEDNILRLNANRVSNGNRPYAINGKNVQLSRNTWSDFKDSAILGYSIATSNVRDAIIDSDRYVRCGKNGGNGLSVFSIAGLKIKDAKFIDCGTGNAGASNAIDFNTGTSSNVDIEGVEFASPTGKTAIAVQKEGGHTFDASTNKFNKNKLNGLTNNFVAYDSDSIVNSYTPVIEGGSTAGVGTYVEQTGRFYQIGKRVVFSMRVSVTSHTGGGIVEVSIPLPAANIAGTTGVRTLGPAYTTGLAATGGSIARLNVNAVAGGVNGAIRIYYAATGTPGQAVIPAGAFEIELSGEYTTT